MCFHRALGDIEVASDFRVVAALQQQVDDLPLPGSHLIELFVHKSLHLTDMSGSRKWRETCPLGTSGFGSLGMFLHSRGQIVEFCVNCL